jgi:hypothetical protein
VPVITEICGARPDSATFSEKILPKPPSAAAPSCRRAPPDSTKPTTGTPARRLWRSASTITSASATPTDPPAIAESWA